MPPIAGVEFIHGDFREAEALSRLEALLGDAPVDLVLSDMAPNMTGVDTVDQARAMYLSELARDFAPSPSQAGRRFPDQVVPGRGLRRLRGGPPAALHEAGDPQARGLPPPLQRGVCAGHRQACMNRTMPGPSQCEETSNERSGEESAGDPGRGTGADDRVPDLLRSGWRQSAGSHLLQLPRAKSTPTRSRRSNSPNPAPAPAPTVLNFERADGSKGVSFGPVRPRPGQRPGQPQGRDRPGQARQHAVAVGDRRHLPALRAVHRHLHLLHPADAAGRQPRRDDLRALARQAAGRERGEGDLRRRRRLRRGQGGSRPSWSSSCATRASSRSWAGASRAAC